MQRRVWMQMGLGMVVGALAGCGEPPNLFPQGSAEEQSQAVRKVLDEVITGLRAGQSRALLDRELIFLPSRWRKQAKEFEELSKLSASLSSLQGEVRIGNVQLAGRWALVERVHVGETLIGKADLPWFMFYFAGQWHWMPSSILKDPAIEGMMDRHFDALWATWQAQHQGAK